MAGRRGAHRRGVACADHRRDSLARGSTSGSHSVGGHSSEPGTAAPRIDWTPIALDRLLEMVVLA